MILSVCKRRGKEKESTRQWDEDMVMVPNNELVSPFKHSFFFEYLKLVIQYGFVTIFVAAFPLAPLLAWVNNIIEIRLDAHKFVQVIRRPIAERSQDIGAWFHLLHFTTRLCVVTNGLLIAFTSDFIDREVYHKMYTDQPLNECLSANSTEDCPHGVVTWSTSPFKIASLLQPLKGTNDETTFPILSVLKTPVYSNGNVVRREALIGNNKGKTENVLYLPFLNFACLKEHGLNFTNFTESEFSYYYTNADFQSLTLRTVGGTGNGRVFTGSGACFVNSTICRFRSQIEEDGGHPLKYWKTLAAKLAFVIVFENFVFVVAIIIDYIVPDIPRSVKEEIRREKQLTSKLLAKAKGK